MVGPSLVLSTYYQILLQYSTFILLFKLSLHIKNIYSHHIWSCYISKVLFSLSIVWVFNYVIFCNLFSKICFHNLPYCWTIQAFLCPAWRFCSETTAPSSPARQCFATTSLCMPRRLSQQPISMSHESCASISSTDVEDVLRYSNSSFMYDIEAVHRDI